MSDVTVLLQSIESGDKAAAAQLLPLVYEELRRLAAHELRSEPSGNTLQPTALVHEAYVRLVGAEDEQKWNHRGHFYGAAARAMRQILVDSARRKKSLKCGGDAGRLPLDNNLLARSGRHSDLLELDAALNKLEQERPELAELVSLRYFAGLTMEQAAKSLSISKRTAERNWTYARAWLLEAME
jgi:RNA polymerase sigma factor (TIGR02999 family)